MGLSLGQLLIILVIVLVLFGAGKLPQMMSDMGKGMKAFKDGTQGDAKSPTPKKPRATNKSSINSKSAAGVSTTKTGDKKSVSKNVTKDTGKDEAKNSSLKKTSTKNASTKVKAVTKNVTSTASAKKQKVAPTKIVEKKHLKLLNYLKLRKRSDSIY
jgi:sec-independent protein translocase protein TatA